MLNNYTLFYIVNLSTLAYGSMLGWQSPLILQLQSPTPPIGTEPMTDDAVSWLSSIVPLTGFFTVILFSMIPDKFSRKKIGYTVALLLAISWLFVIFATQQTYLFVAKVFSGIAGAIKIFLVPIYVSEISSDDIRGFLGSIFVFNLNLGTLFSYIVADMMSMRAFAILGLAMVVLYFIAFILIPESPIYLIRQNRMEEAARSLTWLKAGNKYKAQQALPYLQEKVEKLETLTKSVKLRDLFKDKATIKGLIITLGLFTSQQLGGIAVMISYAEKIFKILGSSLSPNTSAIILGAIQLFGAILSSLLVERAGRRLLALISCAGMCVCHCVVGIFSYFHEFKYDVSDYGWVPVVGLCTFMIVYSLGMAMVPIVVMSEIFNQNISSLASTICLSCLLLTAFITVKIFPDLINLLGVYGCFFLFSALCGGSFLFFYIMLPETKGRAREDIVDELNGQVMGEKSARKIETNSINTKVLQKC